MLLDHPIASKPSGDLFVNEVTCLDQKVACYKKVQGCC